MRLTVIAQAKPRPVVSLLVHDPQVDARAEGTASGEDSTESAIPIFDLQSPRSQYRLRSDVTPLLPQHPQASCPYCVHGRYVMLISNQRASPLSNSRQF